MEINLGSVSAQAEIPCHGLGEALAQRGWATPGAAWLDATAKVMRAPHGDWRAWAAALRQLPEITPACCDFAQDIPRFGAASEVNDRTRARLEKALLALAPWRKGGLELFGVRVDSEWRSELKWARVAAGIGDLRGRRVLDVGCGNGYYLWRMLGAGADLAVGIDPSQLFSAQFSAFKRYALDAPAFVLPLRSAQFLPPSETGFDSLGFDKVFSMGVLSHRRAPLQHLRELLSFAGPGGEVVVENLVVDGDAEYILKPRGRYAKMRNIYGIPSPLALEAQLRRAGARQIELLDISVTTVDEQRATRWMQFESLSDFLDPADSNKTIEGYPAPQRAVFRCLR